MTDEYTGRIRMDNKTNAILNYGSKLDKDNHSTSSTQSSSDVNRQSNTSALPRVRSRYIPSLYHNQDKKLTEKIQDFLKKPPLNSPEYHDMLWLRRKSENYKESNGGLAEFTQRETRSAPSSPDELSKKFRHLLPENRSIQSMILPPIRAGCTGNNHGRLKSSKTAPEVDQSASVMDQLRFCRYIRPKPVPKSAWREEMPRHHGKINHETAI